jgi:cyclase
MDKDGTKTGYDLELTKIISSLVSIPVIASGGAGSLDDLYQGFRTGLASAVLAASIFHFKNYTIKEVKSYLKKRDIPIRE